ncbi:hypothetical protein JW930_01460 [Candidatus Woesearchaeota archaeon]|nr:hypothetical protein [Candidatus Woesearchaeota archaeon]
MKKKAGARRNIFLVSIAAIVISTFVLAEGILLMSNQPFDADDPMLFLSLGDFLYNNGMTGYAVKIYERAEELDPDNPAILNNFGIAYITSDEEKAEGYFLKAMTINPEYELARKNLAILYNKQEKYDKAAEQLLILTNLHPENIQYNYDLAINLAHKFYYISKSKEDVELSLKYLYKVQSLSPGFERTEENIQLLEEILKVMEGN